VIGILLLYFIWKFYTDLAVEYGKNKWGYALLGIASYYAGAITGGFIIGITGTLIDQDPFEGMSDSMAGLIAFPFGVLTVWLLHRYLRKRWSNNKPRFAESESLDNDLLNSSAGE
jgi:hypothetical protein